MLYVINTCVIVISALTGSSDNTLSYESKVSEVLETEDGSSLDAVCVQPYLDAATDKTNFMKAEIENELSRSGCSASVHSVTHAHTLIFFENQVSVLLNL